MTTSDAACRSRRWQTSSQPDCFFRPNRAGMTHHLPMSGRDALRLNGSTYRRDGSHLRGRSVSGPSSLERPTDLRRPTSVPGCEALRAASDHRVVEAARQQGLANGVRTRNSAIKGAVDVASDIGRIRGPFAVMAKSNDGSLCRCTRRRPKAALGSR